MRFVGGNEYEMFGSRGLVTGKVEAESFAGYSMFVMFDRPSSSIPTLRVSGSRRASFRSMRAC